MYVCNCSACNIFLFHFSRRALPSPFLEDTLCYRMVSLLATLLGAAIPAYALPAARAVSSCSAATAITRKEYGQLTDDEKLSFVSAVQCVMAKPSIMNDVVPATTNRFDDYAAVHVNNTLGIHINGAFLSWYSTSPINRL
jgi:hypothetical protein